MDWSVFYPIASSPGYKTDNKLPYAEHFNFSMQRELTASHGADPGLCGNRRPQAVLALRSQSGQRGALPEPARLRRAKGHYRSAAATWRTPLSRCPTAARSSERAARWDRFTTARTATWRPSPTRSTIPSRLPWSGAPAISPSWRPTPSARRWTTPPAYGAYLDFYNFRLGRALSTFDCTHNFVASYSYTLPVRPRIRARFPSA